MVASGLYDDGNAHSNKEPIVQTLESGIMNLHINLTSLEGKYIDLANFYKQELLNRKKEKDVQRVKVSSVTAKKNI